MELRMDISELYERYGLEGDARLVIENEGQVLFDSDPLPERKIMGHVALECVTVELEDGSLVDTAVELEYAADWVQIVCGCDQCDAAPMITDARDALQRRQDQVDSR
jgi:hypothetical protein